MTHDPESHELEVEQALTVHDQQLAVGARASDPDTTVYLLVLDVEHIESKLRWVQSLELPPATLRAMSALLSHVLEAEQP
jgi:hypothetical protein